MNKESRPARRLPNNISIGKANSRRGAPTLKAQPSRVRIIACDEAAGTVMAEVRGSGAVYAAGHGPKGWSCDCPAKSKNCAHVLALKLVTVLEPRGTR
jgi:SWIM zinc finger